MGLLRKIFGASKARDSQTPAKARSGAQHLDNSHVEEELPLLIKEGFGVKGVKVGRSTKDDVIAAFGKGYELITYGSYSTELKYKRTGLSFCYLNDDPEERVFSISVSSPCRAETERGISLNQRSLADVLSVYGSPTHAFLTTDTSDEWFFMYTSLGLIFQVKKDSSIPFDECPLSKQYKELHRNRRISAITVERPTATDIEEKESNVEAIFEEPVIPVSDYDSFEVTCALINDNYFFPVTTIKIPVFVFL